MHISSSAAGSYAIWTLHLRSCQLSEVQAAASSRHPPITRQQKQSRRAANDESINWEFALVFLI